MNVNQDFEGLDEFAAQNAGGDVPPNAGGGVPPNVAGTAVVPPPLNVSVALHGGVYLNLPCTGGSLDPALQALTPCAPLCYRSEAINHQVWTQCERG